MRIGIFHGWELTGSGSNEYTRYLSRELTRAGHQVHVACREERPEKIAHVATAIRWDESGCPEVLFEERQLAMPDPAATARAEVHGSCTLHMLPHGPVRPVFVTDKQREGNVKAFTELHDDELIDYRSLSARVLRAILTAHPVDILHANHMLPQPTIAANVCPALGIPFIIYPHGSAIEYSVRGDARYLALVEEAIAASSGLIIGSEEVRQRLLQLYPRRRDELLGKSKIVGVGVDTALFAPVARGERREAIARFEERCSTRDLHGGKTRAQGRELALQLDNGDVEATQRYREAYDHSTPDAEVIEKVGRIPWQEGKILFFVGALTVGKGLQSVLTALPEVLRQEPDTHLVIVGSGAYREVLEALVHGLATENETLVDKLTARGSDLDRTHLKGPWTDVAAYLRDPEQRAVALGAGPSLADHVHFLGRLDHDLLRFVFPCVDVAVFPSVLPEAYPLVLMESLANGVLPAASDFSGFAEGLDNLVPDLGAARVDLMRLPVDDATRVTGIARRLAQLLSSTRDWSADLRAIAVRRFDWSVRSAQMLAAYIRFSS